MSSSSDDSEECSWVSKLLNSPYGKYLCKVDLDYIRDKFNLTYLERDVTNFRKAYSIIVDSDSEDLDDEFADEAIQLYGLIHARFILTPAGLLKMYSMFKEKRFGTCPRIMCENCPVLPVGLSDRPGKSQVHVYCPRCRDIYIPSRDNDEYFVDGAWIGTSFPHFLLQTYKDLPFNKEPNKYVPKIFGFKLLEK